MKTLKDMGANGLLFNFSNQQLVNTLEEFGLSWADKTALFSEVQLIKQLAEEQG